MGPLQIQTLLHPDKLCLVPAKLHLLFVSILRQTGGISNAQRFLLTTGILIGKRKKKFAISFPTLIKIANSAKLKFHRGRPKLEAV